MKAPQQPQAQPAPVTTRARNTKSQQDVEICSEGRHGSRSTLRGRACTGPDACTAVRHVHVCMHACTNVDARVRVYACDRARLCLYVCACAPVPVLVCMCTCGFYVHVCMCLPLCVCECMRGRLCARAPLSV
eukprot:6204040-Pleurochrysis_carterae.AAC.3